MTTFKEPTARDVTRAHKLTISEILETLSEGNIPLRFTAYDGSAAGPEDAAIGLNLNSPRGTTYLVTAPGDLGMARAYVSGDLEPVGVHPGDPYDMLRLISDELHFRRPGALTLASITRSLGWDLLRPIAPPPQEVVPRWRRIAEGLRHSKTRDADSISHHYDVSNTFYEYVLGPSMTYTCATYTSPEDTLEAAQENKYRLVFEKLGLKEGDRLLDIGCGWGGMVRYAARRGVRAIGATLSKEQAAWAQQAIADEGLSDPAEVRFSDDRAATETEFDAVSSIGLTEHIGVHNYPAYFGSIKSKLRVGGRVLNHCITRPDNRAHARAGSFIDRYVFPDGELTGSGHRDAGRGAGSSARGESPRALRAHPESVVREPGGELGRLRRRSRCGHRTCVGSVHGRIAARIRTQRRSAAPGAGRQARQQGRGRFATAPLVGGVRRLRRM